MTSLFLDRAVLLGAAGRGDLRRTGAARYAVAGARSSLVRRGWTVASAEDGTAQPAPGLEAGQVVSYAESFQAVKKLRRADPAVASNLMLVRVPAPAR
jgi:hypothetical protein